MDPLTWRSSLHLPDATVHIADVHQSLSNQDTWRATLPGHLYLLAGTSTDSAHRDRITAYAGITERHTSGRAWASLARWVRSIAALQLHTIGLVTLNDPRPDPDVLRVLECSVIRALSPRVQMLNTVTAAATATQALGEHAPIYAAYGDFLATALRRHVLGGRSNPLLTPAHSVRESAVRVILAADSALDTDDVLTRLQALGGPQYTGKTAGATLRRDLTIRETNGYAGPPRIRTTHLAGRCLYYPAHMPEYEAVHRYAARTSRRAAKAVRSAHTAAS